VVLATSACVRDWWKSEHFASFYGFFRSECKYILFLPTMHAYFGILLYCLKIAETTVVLIAFMSVPCHARVVPLLFLTISSTCIRYQKTVICIIDTDACSLAVYYSHKTLSLTL